MTLRARYEHLRSSYWFLPTVMAAGAAALALALVAADRTLQGHLAADGFWILPASAEGARAILSTVASSMITVTGVVFSITVVTLSLASQQFGPRLLQNFMRDRGNQAVLGTGTATFLYCLLVLRTVTHQQGQGFVPQVSLVVAVGLGVACVGALIYFIHHVAETIQVTRVVATVGQDLVRSLERLFPGPDEDRDAEEDGPDPADPPELSAGAGPIAARRTGYVQAVDLGRLVDLAEDQDLVLRLACRPGRFVVRGQPVAQAWPAPGDEETAEELGAGVDGSFTLGSRRTPEQDPGFLVDELVEIGARALSPGINDPFTAMSCIDHLVAALCRLATRRPHRRHHRDGEGKVRVITEGMDFPELTRAAFDQLRGYSRGNPSVTLHLLAGLGSIAPFTRTDAQRLALLRQVELVEAENAEVFPWGRDREGVRRTCRHLRETLEALLERRP